VLGTMAQLYLSDLKQKTWRGQLGRALQGKVPGGKAYGYDLVTAATGERQINPVEAAIVSRIFTEFANGHSPRKSEAKQPIERSDDPVRMYLREMGSIALLSRQGEIAIAKRIEAGQEAMIAGLCESPLTFQAVTIWRDELKEGKVFLRDIIDLEATYAGPDANAVPAAVPRGDAPSTVPMSKNSIETTVAATERTTAAMPRIDTPIPNARNPPQYWMISWGIWTCQESTDPSTV
jgi:hypothetical protein